MEPRNEQRPPESAVQSQTEKKTRFQLVKLEERIAPGQGGNTHGRHCGGGGGDSSGSSGGQSFTSGSIF
jgi:hypothetical protein